MSEMTYMNVGMQWWKKTSAFVFMKLIWVGEDNNNVVKSVSYTISYKIIGTMAKHKLDREMGIRRTEGSEIFCKVVDAGFF